MESDDDIWGVGMYMDNPRKDSFPEPFCSFIDEVCPNISAIQDVEGVLVLIHIRERTSFLCRGDNGELVFDECRGAAREAKIIEEGLFPLVEHLIVTKEEAGSIKDWFLWALDSIKDIKPFSRYFEVNGIRYFLYTEKDGRKRRLCLRIFHVPSRT